MGETQHRGSSPTAAQTFLKDWPSTTGAMAVPISEKLFSILPRRVLTSGAVETNNAEDQIRTALRAGKNAIRADSGESAGSEESNDGELHFEGSSNVSFTTS